MLLDGLGLEEWTALKNQSIFRKYLRGDIIFHRGDTPTHLNILCSGQVVICNYTPNGERTVITTIQKKGDSFGEVYLFLDAQWYEFFAVAETDCTVQHIPKDYAFSMPTLMAQLLQLFARKAYTLNQRVQILSNSNLREKLQSYLFQMKNEHNEVLLQMTREELADFLSTTRPSLSRELMKMQSEGLILVEKAKITLL